MEELSNKLDPSIKELKEIYQKIDESKDKLKMEIQNIFTKIRTELNKREDELYEEIDKKYNELFFKEDFIKESEKLPNLVKISLERGKMKENEWDDDKKLNKLINDCIIIENTIKNINEIYEKIEKFNSNKELKIEFEPKQDEIQNGFLKSIRTFGSLKELKPELNKDDKNFVDKKELIQLVDPKDNISLNNLFG